MGARRALKGDKRRQAGPTLAGYAYQLWHSLHAWLSLKEDQVLYLEGAEDFDLIDGESATAVQVKMSGRSISLRSEASKKALANYLEIQRLNPGRDVMFRFLTTAHAAIENGAPFGGGLSGIQLWNRVQDYEEGGRKLLDFLVTEASLPEQLREFLHSSDVSGFVHDLVLPVKWETASRGPEYVEAAVKRVLIVHGENVQVPPSESAKLVDSFLRRTFETAIHPTERSLCRADFLELFEELTTVRVPRHELASRSYIPVHLSSELVQKEGEVLTLLEGIPRVRREVPPLLPLLAERRALLTGLKDRLDASHFLILTGSSGMGKTTLAAKLAASRGKTIWADCAAASAEIPLILEQALSLAQGASETSLIVLDDLDLSPSAVGRFETHLGSFLYSFREDARHRRQVLVTSQRSLPSRLKRALGIQHALEESIPALEPEDIEEFAINMGCPEVKAGNWKGIILLNTSGHPQLVHAHLLALRDRNWPDPKLDDILSEPEDVKDEKRGVRAGLLQTLPEEIVLLLYYLSTYIGHFRRDHAKAIGELDSLRLQNPGDLFDSIIGPWVESVGAGYFRVSALLSNAAGDSWTQERTKSVHRELAELIPRVGHLTLREASSTLAHSLAGGAELPLFRICSSLLASRELTRERIADAMPWVAAVSTAKNSIPGSPFTRCLFRAVQYRIAEACDPDQLSEVALAWKREIEELPDDRLRDFQRIFLAGEIISSATAPLSPRVRMDALLELARINQQDEQLAATLRLLMQGLLETLPESGDLLGSLFPLIAFQCKGPEQIFELIEILEEVPDLIRRRILAAYRHARFERALFVDNAWIGEVRSHQPEWTRPIAVLRAVVRFAGTEGVASMQASAYAALAAIYSEHLGDPLTAHQYLDEAQSALGDHPVVMNQRGAVFFEEGRYEAALEVWASLIATWDTDGVEVFPDTRLSDLIFSTRNSGISAACLGSWYEAAEFFKRGASVGAGMEDLAYAPAFLADAGFCYWRAGDVGQSLSSFEEALLELEKLPDPELSLRSRVRGKLIGHVLLWVETVSRKGDTSRLSEPTPGLCSGNDYPPELGELFVTPTDMSWLHLVKIEASLREDMAIFDRQRRRLTTSPLAVVRLFARSLDLRRAFRLRRLAGLPRETEHVEREYSVVEFNRGQGRQIWEPDIPGEGVHHLGSAGIAEKLFVAALLVHVVSCDPEPESLFAAWQAVEVGERMADMVAIFIERASQDFALGQGEARRVLGDDSVERLRRLLSAVYFVVQERVRPDDRFYAHLTLFDAFAGGHWSDLIEAELATIVGRQWITHAESPGLLRSPRLSVPAILQACRSDLKGMSKVASILLAASLAVNVTIRGGITERLRSFAVDG